MIYYSLKKNLPLKKDFYFEILKNAKMHKNYTEKSKLEILIFSEILLGNLLDSFVYENDLILRLSNLERKYRKILDSFEDLNYIKIKKGFKIDKERYSITRIEPTYKILNIIDNKNLKVRTSWNIVLRKNNEEVLLKKFGEENEILKKAANKFQKRINFPIFSFKRIFTNDIENGGRIYSKYQNLSKIKRKYLLIDDEETTEIDFKYNQMRMLFNFFDFDNKDEDPYTKFDLERKKVKKAFSVLINSKQPEKALSCGEFCWEKKKIKNFVERAYDLYPFLKDIRGQKISLKLQKIEGDIALDMLRFALYNNIVVLPIHDSFIVKNSEAEEIKEEMEKIWLKNVLTSRKFFVK